MVEWWNDSNEDFVEHVLWNKRRNHMEIFQGRLKGQQLPGRLLRGRWIHPRVIVVNTKELHHENSAARKRMLKHTDTSRAVQVAEPYSKVAPGRHR